MTAFAGLFCCCSPRWGRSVDWLRQPGQFVARARRRARTRSRHPVGSGRGSRRLVCQFLTESVSLAGLVRRRCFTPLDVAASSGAIKVVRVLLDNSTDPNRRSRNGATPLVDASLKGLDSIAGMPLDHRVQVNRLNPGSGTTALYAASFSKSEVVKLLLNRGAKPALCGNNRKTPYQAALENGYSEVATQIRNHGGTKSCEQ
jgi:ankyrin repeat protein